MVVAVPTYSLYGDESPVDKGFWLHCETIISRSSAYKFEIGSHRHEYFLQFLYIRAGSGDAVLPQAVVPLRPPCVIAVPAGVTHGFRFSRDIDGFVITLLPDRLNRLDRDAFSRWLRQPAVIPLDLAVPEASYLDTTFLRIAAEYESQLPGRDEVLETYVTSLMILLSRRISPQDDEAGEDPAFRRLQTLQQLISRHYRQHLPVEEYAALMGMSSTHLNRIVRQATGRSTHDLLTERLMEEARRELVFTGYSVQQVSENLGFTDPAYFSRVFRQRSGMTPRQYRERERARMRNKEAEALVTVGVNPS
ncbi:helix-turn-helix domain-containing protein [Rhizobium helianthi]|uniref:Helix-turn-helix domain-containing protein n=1 Tax=Rhizobium helianthi TaxID=1132695 RepID=A0ABW4M268_9HYPH